VRNLAFVGRRGEPSLEGLGRIVGIVRIVKVQPHEKRPRRSAVQPSQRLVDHLVSPTLNAFVPVFSLTAPVKSGIVNVEAAVKTGGSMALGIEDVGANEGGGTIAAAVENVGQIGQVF